MKAIVELQELVCDACDETAAFTTANTDDFYMLCVSCAHMAETEYNRLVDKAESK